MGCLFLFSLFPFSLLLKIYAAHIKNLLLEGAISGGISRSGNRTRLVSNQAQLEPILIRNEYILAQIVIMCKINAL